MTFGAMETEFRAKRAAGRKLLVPYLTGGLGPWTEHARAMAEAGADVIEVGIPFSDPVMDGPTIQAASEQALRQGTTPASVFEDARSTIRSFLPCTPRFLAAATLSAAGAGTTGNTSRIRTLRTTVR